MASESPQGIGRGTTSDSSKIWGSSLQTRGSPGIWGSQEIWGPPLQIGGSQEIWGSSLRIWGSHEGASSGMWGSIRPHPVFVPGGSASAEVRRRDGEEARVEGGATGAPRGEQPQPFCSGNSSSNSNGISNSHGNGDSNSDSNRRSSSSSSSSSTYSRVYRNSNSHSNRTFFPSQTTLQLAFLIILLLTSLPRPSSADGTRCDQARVAQLRARLREQRRVLEVLRGALHEHDADGQERGDTQDAAELAQANKAYPISSEATEQRERALFTAGRCQGLLTGPANWRMGFGKGTLPWVPTGERYLLADCHMGQTSNRLRCYRNFLLLAGIMNRTLVVPYRRSEIAFSYNPRLLLPLGPLRACYGRRAVITLREYREQHGGAPLHVSKIFCLRTPDKPCYHQPGYGKPDKLPASVDVLYGGSNCTGYAAGVIPATTQNFPGGDCLGETWKSGRGEGGEGPGPGVQGGAGGWEGEGRWERGKGGMELTYLGYADQPVIKLRELGGRVEAASRGASAVLVQDLEGALIQAQEFADNTGDLPFVRDPGCPNPLAPQPHPVVFLAARRYVKHKGLRRFMALHWRRGDLLPFCDSPLCRLSPEESAACAVEVMKQNGINKIFIASDGTKNETRALRGRMRELLPSVETFSLGEDWQKERWAVHIFEEHPFRMQDRGLVQATLDKIVCALASVFVGTMSSSFSTDIERLREGLRLSTCVDVHLCYRRKE